MEDAEVKLAKVFELAPIKCPCCGGYFLPKDGLYEELAYEIERFDRRFDSGKAMLSYLLEVVAANSKDLVEVPGDS